MTSILIFLALLAAIFFYVASLYNKLVTLRNRYKNSYSQIDVQLKRRHDLIPNLVETAKGYMKHERETLEAVITARNQAVQVSASNTGALAAGQIQAVGTAESNLTGALGKLFALSESYPDLKANQNMMQLTEELTSTENKISFARQAFNDSVTQYNTAIEVFPANFVASSFSFTPSALLVLENKAEAEPIKVSFS